MSTGSKKWLTLGDRSHVRHAARIVASPGEEESLVSVIARTAATHFLSVADFMREVISPLVPDHEKIALLDWDNLPHIVGPNVHAERAIRVFDAVTGLDDHLKFTFKPFEKLWTHQSLRLRQFRAWCPDCYLQDIRSNKPAYDRLIWSALAVTHCPVHRRVLHSKCLNCGKERERFHGAGYQPGICGSCGIWLRPSAASHLRVDDRLTFDMWRSSALHELLAWRDAVDSLNVSSVGGSIRRVAEVLFGGNQNAMARHLRISKAHLSQCIAGKAVPATDRLLMISFVSQIPLVDFYSGAAVSTGFMRLMPLPPVLKERAARVNLTEDIRARVQRMLTRIESNELNHLRTWKDAARFAKVNIDAVYSVAGPSRKSLSTILKARRTENLQLHREVVTRLTYEAIQKAFVHFEISGRRIARRPIMRHAATLGVSIDYRAHNWIYSIVLKERGNPDKDKNSGPTASGSSSTSWSPEEVGGAP